MSAVLHTTLLHETRQNPVCRTGEILTKSNVCVSVLEPLLLGLQEAGMVTLRDEEIQVTPEQRMRIAELAISMGADPENVARQLRWQEFEGLVASILGLEGYATANHFIFRHASRKYEIDVLGAKERMILCVDCKHWHHGWAPSKIMAAARSQLVRVQSLSQVFSLYEKKHRIVSWRSVRLLPVVLTLADVSLKLMDGVPIVSALRFKDFLCQVSPWIETLRFVDVPARSQVLVS
ncbi:MAG TPA: restriction endonuclease [Candidatus Acidoferrum sp.]|nr:restriction endonuclease [Candidatus Acidoferrum sp.]